MTTDKAIEILGGLAESVTAGVDDEEREAIGLGIEALKKIERLRESQVLHDGDLLPGETRIIPVKGGGE